MPNVLAFHLKIWQNQMLALASRRSLRGPDEVYFGHAKNWGLYLQKSKGVGCCLFEETAAISVGVRKITKAQILAHKSQDGKGVCLLWMQNGYLIKRHSKTPKLQNNVLNELKKGLTFFDQEKDYFPAK